MTIYIGHSFQTSQAQSANSNLVSRSAWNEAHSFTMQGPAVLGRVDATSGLVGELAPAPNTGYVLRELGGEIGWGQITSSAISGGLSIELSTSPLLVGRYSAGSGAAQEVGLSGFDFAGSLLRIQAKAVSYDRIQDVLTSPSMLGRFSAGSGVVQEIQLVADRGGPQLDGGSNLVGASIAGDLFRAFGTSAISIVAKAVTYSKIQDLSASQLLLGRNVAGSGSISEITLHNALDWLGTTIGQILYKASATQWAVLSPGTSGHFLQSQSAGVAPKYAAGAVASESGTWTPVFTLASSGLGDLTVSYLIQSGDYSKNGQDVRIAAQLYCLVVTFVTASGVVKATGLPFSSNAAGNNNPYVQSTAFGGVSIANRTQMSAFILGSVTDTQFFGSGMGGGVQNQQLAASTHFVSGQSNIGFAWGGMYRSA